MSYVATSALPLLRSWVSAQRSRKRPAHAEDERRLLIGQKNPQTLAKRARENALREKRERKRVKKEEAAAARRAAGDVEGASVDERGGGEPA
jgi:hypothetical protein